MTETNQPVFLSVAGREGVKSKVNNAFTGLTCGRCVTGH